MKIEIYNSTAFGTLCYDMDNINRAKREYKFDYVFWKVLTKLDNLSWSIYDDFVDLKYYVRLCGSITNMMRFRKRLEYLCHLNDIA